MLSAICIVGRPQLTLAPDGASTGPDLITAAANQARDHAVRAAVTGIGPGTVEQLTAEVVQLARSYVAPPPLSLFAAMHQALGQVQAALGEKTHPPQARDLNFLAGVLCGLLANASLDLGARTRPTTWPGPPGPMARSSVTARSPGGLWHPGAISSASASRIGDATWAWAPLAAASVTSAAKAPVPALTAWPPR